MKRFGRRGFTIIEIMASLIIGVGLLVGSLGYVAKAFNGQGLYETQQMFASFTASIEPYIRGKQNGSTANNTGTFKPEVVRFIQEVVENTPGAKFTGSYENGPWSLDVAGTSYNMFIFPYAAIARDFDNKAECQAFLGRLKQNLATSGMYVIPWDRCGNGDRRGAGIRYTRFHF